MSGDGTSGWGAPRGRGQRPGRRSGQPVPCPSCYRPLTPEELEAAASRQHAAYCASCISSGNAQRHRERRPSGAGG